MFGIFKRKKKKEEKKCYHDWEKLDFIGWYEVVWWNATEMFFRDKEKARKYLNKLSEIHGRDYIYIDKVCNMVCLKCGECYDGNKEVKKWFKKRAEGIVSRKRKKQQRKELAEKMWEDCNN